MEKPTKDALLQSAAQLAGRTAGLRLLLLFGSRVSGRLHSRSDWDFGYLASVPVDLAALQIEIIRLVGSEAVDLVDLARASALLRYRAAEQSEVLWEAQPGVFRSFWLEAVDFWCDAAPILMPAYERVLAGLGR